MCVYTTKNQNGGNANLMSGQAHIAGGGAGGAQAPPEFLEVKKHNNYCAQKYV